MKYVNKKNKDGKNVYVKDYKKKIKLKKLKLKLFLLMLLVIVGACVMLFAPFFKVSKVICEGNSITSSNDIIKASNIDFNSSIYRISMSTVEENVSAIPYVKSCSATRKFPNIIKIKIEQSKVAGCFKVGKFYFYIDKDLKIIDKQKEKPKDASYEIIGIKTTIPEIGKNIESENEDAIKYLKEITTQIQKTKLKEQLKQIDFTDIKNVKLSMFDDFTVFLGSNEKIDYKITFLLSKAVEKLGDNPKGTFDVSSGTKGIFKEHFVQ